MYRLPSFWRLVMVGTRISETHAAVFVRPFYYLDGGNRSSNDSPGRLLNRLSSSLVFSICVEQSDMTNLFVLNLVTVLSSPTSPSSCDVSDPHD